jgi:hypothetical protein
MQGNKGLNFRWVSRLLGGIRKGEFFNKSYYHILFGNIFENGHK